MPRGELETRIVEFMQRRGGARGHRRNPSARDSTATLILGAHSVALGFITVVPTAAGVAGQVWDPWTEARSFEYTLSTYRSGFLHLVYPSEFGVTVALTGLGLGALGLFLGLRRRRFSLISAVGSSLCTVTPLLWEVFEFYKEARVSGLLLW